MASSGASGSFKTVTDSIHGPIRLNEIERRVVDTASFQRLRHLKQLGLAHLTYPNASHTRFAHSLGVLAIMSRVVDVAADHLDLDEATRQDLRLSALLHDVGHYPYSHLMERLDAVVLTEEWVSGRSGPIRMAKRPYPTHEEVGRIIVTEQEDLCEAIGGQERAARIADIFTRSQAVDPKLSNLIHSSLDMDRLDYLLRDARAVGVPYGEIDLAYMLSNLQLSPTGAVGVRYRALPAAEQFLLARFFMFRTVYYHKTTYAMEEAFRQLLRRRRDHDKSRLPRDGDAVRRIARNPTRLLEFTDPFADRVAQEALDDKDPVVSRLAHCLVYRKPPKLLREEFALVEVADESRAEHNACARLLDRCRERLRGLSRRFKLSLGLFLVAETPPIRIEKRGSLLSAAQARRQAPEEEDELIKVFLAEDREPRSLVDVPQSIIRHCANYEARIARLYVVGADPETVRRLREEVGSW